jgi:hypothetical protein
MKNLYIELFKYDLDLLKLHNQGNAIEICCIVTILVFIYKLDLNLDIRTNTVCQNRLILI